MDKKMYPCLVCGFVGLEEEPWYEGEYAKTFEICPCCGFEFGYSEDHDVKLGFIVTPKDLIEAAFQLYRKQWIEAGIKIAHPEDVQDKLKNGDCLKPEVLVEQLQSLNLDLDNFEIDDFNFEKYIK